jgi:uncharacterized protein YkwD
VTEVNALRADPAGYAAHVQSRLPHYQGKTVRIPGATAIRTVEGVSAAQEALAALRSAEPAGTLQMSGALMSSARDHVRDIGPKGMLSHEGSAGSTLAGRIARYAASWTLIAENISFGPDSAREVVVGLVIDDGVKDRGHRRILLDPRLRLIGVACGPHSVYRTVCVLDFAAQLKERR